MIVLNIIYLCHFFAPDPVAPAARIVELGKGWVQAGHHVKVVTAFPHHPTGQVVQPYRGKLMSHEWLDGIEVFRSWLLSVSKESFLLRTLSHITFMLSAMLFSLPRVGRADILICSSPTFFSLFAGYIFHLVKRIPWVVEVRDLWPGALKDLGVIRNPYLYRLLEWLELWVYRRATHIVVVTTGFKENLVRRGVPVHKVSVITNGVDTNLFKPVSSGQKPFSGQDLSGPKIVLYAGAHGRSQGLEVVLKAARRLARRSDIHFVLVGDGAEKDSLVNTAQEWVLKNVTFMPVQPRSKVPDLYRSADICVITLRKLPIFRTFIPSKIFEAMASGCPVVAALEGEAAHILTQSGGAKCVPPENDEALSTAIEHLVDSPSQRKRMGKASRAFVQSHFRRDRLAARYLNLLEALRLGGASH